MSGPTGRHDSTHSMLRGRHAGVAVLNLAVPVRLSGACERQRPLRAVTAACLGAWRLSVWGQPLSQDNGSRGRAFLPAVPGYGGG